MGRLRLCILDQVRPASASSGGAAAAGIEPEAGLGSTGIDLELTWRSTGATAATIATVLTHPFDAVKVRACVCVCSGGIDLG